ncbi:RDD family protein [Kitasatospora azatica]|uniref:RDD family protein n=1 Tax=Kitasatospora azatica TaxID=58347 RepID=UPI00055EFEA9|nr:RDD family protein [Kitasatospora azatica]
MSYPPDPNNPYGQPQQAPYGVPPQGPYGQQQPVYGYPQQPAPGYGFPQQAAPYGYAPVAPPVLASWGSRVGAYFIDFLIVGIPVIICYVIGIAMVVTKVQNACTTDAYGYTSCDTSSGNISGGGLAVIAVGALVSLVLGIWQLVREGSTGQSVGKKAVGIKLVRELDGQVLGFGMAFVRKLAHFLDNMLCGLGYLWPLWDDKSQTFADKVTSSLVIRA